MNNSPVYTKHDIRDDFDPQVDFEQLLNEQSHIYATRMHWESLERNSNSWVEAESPKKLWKNCVFSWLKAGKKRSKMSIAQEQESPSNSSYNKSKQSRGYISGSVNGIKGCNTGDLRQPLSGLFNPTNRVEDEVEIPYISLAWLNNPQSYGPIYLVT